MFDQYSAIITIMEEYATCRQSTYKLMMMACFEKSAKRIIARTKNFSYAAFCTLLQVSDWFDQIMIETVVERLKGFQVMLRF